MDTERDKLTDLESDIKTTGEDLVADALSVVEIEQAKVDLAPDDPRRPVLAKDAEERAASMAEKTKIETELVEEAQQVD
jgi:hypothetical protein